MADFPTYPTLMRIATDEALQRSKALTRDVVTRPGTDANAIISSGATVGDALVGELIRVEAALYLASATAKDLDRLVFDRYGILRFPATPALGEVTLTCPSPTVLGFSVPAGTKFQTESGTVFLAQTTVAFPAASTGPVVVPVKSSLAGLNQNARIGTITSIPAPIAGQPAGLTATNLTATSGAADEEKDPELQARAQRFYTTAQKGTLKAIERGALSVPGVRTARAFNATNEYNDPARWVQVVIADQFSQQFVNATGTTPTYESQSQALAALVSVALLDYRAAGIYVLPVVGVVALVGITLALRIRAGFDAATVANSAKAHAQDYVNSLAPGQDLLLADLGAAIALTLGVEPLGGSVISPTTDLVANPTVAFRTDTSLIVVGGCFEV